MSGSSPWLENVRGTQVLPIINSDERVICVEAGPGTGKTFGLVRRVQRLMHPDGLNVPGDEVLVVAFNRVIAQQLNREIVDGLKLSAHDGEPTIQTVHAVCLRIIGGQLRMLLPHERKAMIYDILCAYPKIDHRFANIYKADQALRDHEANIKLDIELWQATQEWLIRHGTRLVSELPKLLLDKIHGGDFGEKRFNHIIVDEYQDLTPGLQELFIKLRSADGFFMALGDPRQSIYAFLGNEPKGLDNVEKLVSSTGDTVYKIQMDECSRCPKQIVDASNQLMGLSSSLPMKAISSVSANIHLVVWNTIYAEAKGMAKAIVEKYRQRPEDDHLVMVTRRKFGYMLRDEIRDIDPDLSVDLSFSESLLETWAVREAFLMFCLLVDPDPATWRSWLAYQNSKDGTNRGANASEKNSDAYLRILSSCNDKIKYEDIVEIANARKPPKGKGGKNIHERAKRFVELRDLYRPDDTYPEDFINQLFNFSRWPVSDADEAHTAALDMELTAKKVQAILEHVRIKDSDVSSEDALSRVAKTLRYQIATKEPFESDDKSNLRIMTMWGAKGVTAHHVYILGLCNEALPGQRRDEYPGTDLDYVSEQRRLFYVSITRAKETMVLSRALKIKQNQDKLLGLSVKRPYDHWPRLEMSDFLRDILGFLPGAVTGEMWTGCC